MDQPRSSLWHTLFSIANTTGFSNYLSTTGEKAEEQANKQTKKQTSKHANKQTSKQANKQAGKEENTKTIHLTSQRNTTQISMPAIRRDLPKLLSGVNQELSKRLIYYSSDGSSPARYAFFAIFVAAFIFFIVMVCFVNNKRRKQGRAPMISSYLAPPNYYQSENQYNADAPTNLPTYTPAANPQQDVGYYDKNGNFITTATIPLSTTSPVSARDPQGSNQDAAFPNQQGNPFPNASTNQTSSQTGPPISPHIPTAFQSSTSQSYNTVTVSGMSYTAPNGPPPTRTYNSTFITGSAGSSSNDKDLPPYEAPSNGEFPIPEKSHYKN